MITLQNADKALKDIYLTVINQELDNDISPFFSIIEKTTDNVSGNRIHKLVPYGFSGGVSATSEAGALPQSGGNKYAAFSLELKNLYGTIEISDKAIRASQSNESSFMNLLNAEMEGLLRSSKKNFARMLFGDNSGKLVRATAINENNVSVVSAAKLDEGMIIDIIDTSGDIVRASKRTILSIDRMANNIVVSGNPIMPTFNDTTYLFMQNSRNNELTGLRAIFGTNDIYGLKRNDYGLLTPLSRTYDNTIPIAPQMNEVIDNMFTFSHSKPNVIICNMSVKRYLIDEFASKDLTLEAVEVGGYKTVAFEGIPVIVDRYCDKEDMYFLNTNDFKFHQLTDWQWLESDGGSILKQINGYAGYAATLVKYGDLVCHYPMGQGHLCDISF